ncbi:MAG: arsenite methyltransferase [Caldilineaceae bacterium]|nr:arsenite methyltransferase [Caldilineaceae bacterium]
MQTPTNLVKEEGQQSSNCCAPSCCGQESTGSTARESVTLSAVATPDAIKAQVKEHYAKVAVESTSCCASSCCGQEPIGSQLYDGDSLALVPVEAANSSRGCGNPQEIAALKQGEVVLDLGSGGGLDVLLAARQVGPTGFVYGVDMTDEMLELARRNAAKMGATNVDFLKGHLEDLPLADNTADVIISNCVVNLSPEKENTLSEAFRVLKPGGRLAISDIVVDGDLSGLPVSEAQIRSGLSWAGCIAGALTVDEFTRLLIEAGFEGIEITFDHHYQAADFLGQVPDELASLPMAVLTDLVQRFGSASIKARKPS